jgi:hypothetical protein
VTSKFTEVRFFLPLSLKREIIRNNNRAPKYFPAPFRQAKFVFPGKRFSGSAKEGAMAKRTRITIETNSLLVLRGRKSLRAYCPKCGDEAEMIPLDDVGVVSNMLPAEVQAWMESPDLHYTKTANGTALICLNSVLKWVRRTTEGESALG